LTLQCHHGEHQVPSHCSISDPSVHFHPYSSDQESFKAPILPTMLVVSLWGVIDIKWIIPESQSTSRGIFMHQDYQTRAKKRSCTYRPWISVCWTPHTHPIVLVPP
jgi:hypothetical protein